MKTIDVASLEVETCQMVLLVSIARWLILCVIHCAINIRWGHQPRRIVQRGIDQDGAVDMSINSSIGSSDMGPTETPSTVQTEPRFHDSECSSQADPRPVSPPALASRSVF